MARKCDHLVRAGLVAAGLLVASCRGCLADDVTAGDGSGGAPGTPSSSSSGPLASTGTGPTPDASSSASGDETSSSAESSSTGSPPGSSSSSASTGTGQPCPGGEDGVEPDNFDGAWSGCWDFLNTESITGEQPVIENGALVVTPVENTGWWDDTGTSDSVGWYMYQVAQIDFVVSIDVSTTFDAAHTYQMAGLLLRDPASADDAQEWIKWEIGRRVGVTASLAGRNTAIDPSEWIDTDPAFEDEPAARLGACRIGTQMVLAHRLAVGDPYEEDHVVELATAGVPALDGHVQVGLIANAFSNDASLVARFDNFRFSAADQLDGETCLEKLEAQFP